MNFVCQYCRKNFTDKYKLQRHQKTVKYCIDLQNAKKDSITCQDCRKTFCAERELKSHSCKTIILQEEIKELRNEMNELRRELSQLKEVKEVKIKKKIDLRNLLPINEEIFTEATEKLTLEDVINGPSGMASFALEHIFKGRIICSDISRRKVRYKNSNNENCVDYKMLDLSVKFFTAIREKAVDIIKKSHRDKRLSFKNSEVNYEDDDDYIEDLLRDAEIKTMIKDGADGIGNKKVSDFVEIICSKTLV